MGEQEVEYAVEGKPTKFRIKKISYGDYQRVMGGMGNVELIGNVTKGKIDTIKLVDEIMKISVTGEGGADYHKLDIADGLDLQARVLSFNGLGEEPASFRSQPS